jgi:hypothetical protein
MEYRPIPKGRPSSALGRSLRAELVPQLNSRAVQHAVHEIWYHPEPRRNACMSVNIHSPRHFCSSRKSSTELSAPSTRYHAGIT